MRLRSLHVRSVRPDLALSWVLLSFVLASGLLQAQVVINEIMPAPVSPEPEWVELYNPSADTVILQGVYLHDATSRAPIPMIPIPPGAFVVLSKDTTALRARRALPRDAILVRMTLPSLNNTGESLRLATKDSSTIDSVAYSVSWGKIGVSLERVDPYLPMHSPANCRSSTSSTGATCGSGNSVTPKAGDASVTSMSVDTSRRSLRIVVRNMGDVRLDGATLSVRVDTLLMLRAVLDFDAFGERVFSITLDSIKEFIARHGYVEADAVIDVSDDPRRANDSMWLDVYLSPRRGSLRVNEILYDPLGTGIPLAEFIEVINTDARPLSTAGLFLRIDEDVVAIDARTLQPGDVLAVTCDSVAARAWTDDDRSVCLGRGSFSLRSTWDSVLVTDPYGLVIDSVCYADDWHSRHIGMAKGRSLEKRSPDLPSAVSTSWTSCAATEGCTPGRPNSVARRLDSGRTGSASPNPFSPHSAQGDRQSTVLRFISPFEEAVWTVSLFDTHGRELGTLRNGEYMSGEASAVWDGRNDRGDVLPIGPYVVTCRAVDATSGAVSTHSFVVVIADS